MSLHVLGVGSARARVDLVDTQAEAAREELDQFALGHADEAASRTLESDCHDAGRFRHRRCQKL